LREYARETTLASFVLPSPIKTMIPADENCVGVFVVEAYRLSHVLDTKRATGEWNSSRMSAGQLANT
jgi:hypothetical protein